MCAGDPDADDGGPACVRSVPEPAGDRVADGQRSFSEDRRIDRPEPIFADTMLVGVPIMICDELPDPSSDVLPS